MGVRNFFVLVYCFLLTGCQSTTGQEIIGGEVRFTGNENVVFYDPSVSAKIKAGGVARVSFKDSITLEPVSTSVTIFKMKEIAKPSKKGDQVDFIFLYSGKNNLSEYEKTLLNKYRPKVDSIFMNGQYKFISEKRWLYGRKLDISFSFEIRPMQ